MKTYFLSVLAVALVAGICEEILPEGSAHRHLRLAAGLCVLAVLVLPAKDALMGLSDFVTRIDLSGLVATETGAGEDYEALFSDAMQSHSAKEAGDRLAALVGSAFGIDAGDCRAEVELSADGSASRVLITLSGRGILQDPHAIILYVNGLLACPCDVAVE